MLTGSIMMFAGSTAPQGWLVCDGSAVSRSDYAGLFAVVGTAFGAGDGSTTFNLPDLSGRVVIGSSVSHPAASTGGEEVHTLTVSEIPAHAHEVGQHGHNNGITITTPELSHTITQATFTYSGPGGQGAAGSAGGSAAFSGASSVNASRTTNVAISDHAAADCTVSGGISDCAAFDTESTGLDEAHDNMQPFVTLNYIIYAGE